MKYLLLFISFYIYGNADLIQSVHIIIESKNISKNYNNIIKLIEKNNGFIIESNLNYNDGMIYLKMNKDKYEKFNKFIDNNKEVVSKSYQLQSVKLKKELLSEEIKHIENNILIYKDKIEEVGVNHIYSNYFWQIHKKLLVKLNNLNKEYELYQNISDCYLINITFSQKYYYESDDLDLIVMPGIQFGYLMTDNPKKNISSTSYKGLGLRPMISYGRFYFNFDILESNDSNSEEIKDIIIYGMGIDFYPDSLFRKLRKNFLSIYSGINCGGVFFNTKDDYYSSFYALPYLGIEFVKTKYLIIDFKWGYFVPLKYNRNSRGYLSSFAINFNF